MDRARVVKTGSHSSGDDLSTRERRMQGARGAHSTSRSSYRTLPGPGARRGGAATPLDAVEQPEPALGLLSPFMSVSMWPVSRTNDRWVLRGVAAEGLSAMRGYRRHPGCSGEQRGQVFERVDGAAPGTEQPPPLDPAQVSARGGRSALRQRRGRALPHHHQAGADRLPGRGRPEPSCGRRSSTTSRAGCGRRSSTTSRAGTAPGGVAAFLAS